MRIVRESAIEAKTVAHAKRKGMLSYKFSSPGNRGVPDRIFLYRGIAFFIEFKAPGKKPSKLQRFEMDRIESAGFGAHVVDSAEVGKHAIDDIKEQIDAKLRDSGGV